MPRSNNVLLTNRIVMAAEPKAKRYCLWDSELPGFALRIEPSGRKIFIVRYRANGGGRQADQRMVTIGKLGPLAVDLARQQARRILGGVALGADPAVELKQKRQQMKMSALIDLYEAEGCYIQRGVRQGHPMKEQTKAYTMARLRHHVVPLLGRKGVRDVNAGDIERFVQDVTAGKTAKTEKLGPRRVVSVRGGDGAARKVFQDLSAVFSFAKRREIVERNPCETAAVRKTDNRKERYLTFSEVQRLGKAFDELEAEGTNPKALNIMRLWALTGCRRNEIAALKWSEIDFEHGCLKLAQTKTGKSIRPLGVAAVAILRKIAREDGSEYVFSAEFGDGFFQGYKTPWKRAIEKAGLPGVSPHTLRHTMGSTTVSAGEALAFVGAILGHANQRSTAIYAHVQHEPARQVADRISTKIAAALAGTDVDSSEEADAAGEDEILLRKATEFLLKGGPQATRLRAVLAVMVE